MLPLVVWPVTVSQPTFLRHVTGTRPKFPWHVTVISPACHQQSSGMLPSVVRYFSNILPTFVRYFSGMLTVGIGLEGFWKTQKDGYCLYNYNLIHGIKANYRIARHKVLITVPIYFRPGAFPIQPDTTSSVPFPE